MCALSSPNTHLHMHKKKKTAMRIWGKFQNKERGGGNGLVKLIQKCKMERFTGCDSVGVT